MDGILTYLASPYSYLFQAWSKVIGSIGISGSSCLALLGGSGAIITFVEVIATLAMLTDCERGGSFSCVRLFPYPRRLHRLVCVAYMEWVEVSG